MIGHLSDEMICEIKPNTEFASGFIDSCLVILIAFSADDSGGYLDRHTN